MIRLRSARLFFVSSCLLASALVWVTCQSVWLWWLQAIVIVAVGMCWGYFQLLHTWRLLPTAVVAMWVDGQGDLWLRYRNGCLVRKNIQSGLHISRRSAFIPYSRDGDDRRRWLLMSLARLSAGQRSQLIYKLKFKLSTAPLSGY